MENIKLYKVTMPLSASQVTLITGKFPIASTNRTQHTVNGHIFPLTLIQREEGKLSSCSQLVSNKQNLQMKENHI